MSSHSELDIERQEREAMDDHPDLILTRCEDELRPQYGDSAFDIASAIADEVDAIDWVALFDDDVADDAEYCDIDECYPMPETSDDAVRCHHTLQCRLDAADRRTSRMWTIGLTIGATVLAFTSGVLFGLLTGGE